MYASTSTPTTCHDNIVWNVVQYLNVIILFILIKLIYRIISPNVFNRIIIANHWDLKYFYAHLIKQNISFVKHLGQSVFLLRV